MFHDFKCWVKEALAPKTKCVSRLIKPLNNVSVPGIGLFYKDKCKLLQEDNRRKYVTEKELDCLNHKIVSNFV